jgi:hypothetical protein
MPWRPDWSPSPVDHRLDPYRDRGGVVLLDDGVLRIYVQVDQMCTQVSGHLWWRRWSPPREFVILHMLLDEETPTDTYLDEEDLDNELTYWAGGRFLWLGREYPLAWFRTHESAALRHMLGLDEQ